MFDPEIPADDDIVDVVDDILDGLRPKKPKRCGTCASATALCSQCHPDCPDYAFRSKCALIKFWRDPAGVAADHWRECGGVGDCPVWSAS